MLRTDQVLVGMNRTRRLYNKRIRELMGLRDPMPAAGEKLVCLRNDKQKGLLNGGIWTVKKLREPLKGFVRMELTPEEEQQPQGGSREGAARVLRGRRTRPCPS